MNRIKQISRTVFMSAIAVLTISGLSTAFASGSLSFNTSLNNSCNGSCSAGSETESGDIVASNGTTGPNSINKNNIDIDDSSDIRVVNEATANNDYDIDAEAGFGNVGSNTCVGDIKGGDIMGSLSSVTNLNSGTINLMNDSSDDDMSIVLANSITGPNSVNVNDVDIDRTSNINVLNSAVANNNLDIKANTGKNRVSNNTVVGDVSSGDVNIDASVNTNLNAGSSNMTIPTSIPSASVSFSNGTTGPNSSNRNEADIDMSRNICVENSAEVNNDFDVNLNSGRNTIGHNTVVGDVSTGDVSFTLNAVTNAN